MPYEIEISDDAERAMKKLDRKLAQRVYAKLVEVAASPDPFQRVKRLTGVALFSLRVGSYRVIIDIRRNTLVILVLKIGHRGKVYEGL